MLYILRTENFGVCGTNDLTPNFKFRMLQAIICIVFL